MQTQIWTQMAADNLAQHFKETVIQCWMEVNGTPFFTRHATLKLIIIFKPLQTHGAHNQMSSLLFRKRGHKAVHADSWGCYMSVRLKDLLCMTLKILKRLSACFPVNKMLDQHESHDHELPAGGSNTCVCLNWRVTKKKSNFSLGKLRVTHVTRDC